MKQNNMETDGFSRVSKISKVKKFYIISLLSVFVILYAVSTPDFKGREWIETDLNSPRKIAETDIEYFFRVLKNRSMYTFKLIRGELMVALFKIHYSFLDDDDFDVYESKKAIDISMFLNEEDFSGLPDFYSIGDLPSLRSAMFYDPKLKKLIEEFASRDVEDIFINYKKTNNEIERILYRWAVVENIDPDSRGWFIDARVLRFTEKFMGRAFIQMGYYKNPMPYGAQGIKGSWEAMFRMIKSFLIYQILEENKLIDYLPSKSKCMISYELLDDLADKSQSMSRSQRREVYKSVSDIVIFVCDEKYAIQHKIKIFRDHRGYIFTPDNLDRFLLILFPEIQK